MLTRAALRDAAAVGFALGVAAGVTVGLWAIGATSAGPAGHTLLALLLPAAVFAGAGAAAVPLAFWLMGRSAPARERAPAAGIAARLLGAVGAVAAAALLALALQRGLAAAVPGVGWRLRLSVSAGLWLVMAGTAVRLVRALPGAHRRTAGTVAAIVSIVACAVLLAGSPGPRDEDRSVGAGFVHASEPPAAAYRPNLALIVLDTTRADHLSLYGYARPTSPFLEEIAKDATVYDNAISPAPWTLPAHASLFTGQLPSVHDADTEHRYLDDRFVTVAEILQRTGYDTAGFSSNSVAGSIYNLHQGFARFDEVWRLRAKAADDPLSRLLPAAALRWIDTGTFEGDKGAALVNRLVAAWLDERSRADDERPFFLFVNYVEAHLPYSAPEPWRSRFQRGALPRRLAAVTGADAPDVVFGLMGAGGALTGLERERIADLYDAGLAYQDVRLRELVDDLAQRGILDQTLLVIVSDHGENLGDHGGLLSHAFSLHRTLVHVPLLVRYPAQFARGARETTPVSTLAVFATLLHAASAAPDPSFVPTVGPLGSEGATAGGAAISEYGMPVYELSLLANESRGTDIRPFAVRQRAAQDARHKLVVRSSGSSRLYDLAQDPSEDHPLPAAGRPEAERLASLLGEVLSHRPEAAGQPETTPGSLDAATRDALRALGYVR